MSPSKQKKKKSPKATKEQESGPRIRTVADNRRAFHEYDLLERIEAGLVLAGTEIKSIRASKVNIRDAYAQVRDGEMWLQNMHIAPWSGGGPWNHEPVHPRRLLLHKKEILRLGRAAAQQGLTIVPLRVYIKGHHAKIELALAKGRRRHDKRQAIIRRETEREIARAMKRAV